MYSAIPCSRNLSILLRRTGSPRLVNPLESDAMMMEILIPRRDNLFESLQEMKMSMGGAVRGEVVRIINS
jgi:hypothetical protein